MGVRTSSFSGAPHPQRKPAVSGPGQLIAFRVKGLLRFVTKRNLSLFSGHYGGCMLEIKYMERKSDGLWYNGYS